MKKNSANDLPSVTQLEAELKRETYRGRYWIVLRNTIYSLIVVAAVASLVAMLWMPVLQIYGTSMTPTLHEGEIVVSLKSKDFKQGDLLSFYYGNKLLVKRCIAGPGDWIDIDEDGNVFINGKFLEEPYLVERALGETDIEYPYQVPDERYFLMGDHRSTSVDSRSSTVGTVAEEQIVGRIVFCVWPLTDFGRVE